MKIISVVVFLCFLILPTITRVGHIFFLFITKGAKAVGTLEQPSPRFQPFVERRILIYSLAGLYFLLFFGSLYWMLYELMGESFVRLFVETNKEIIIFVTTFAIFILSLLSIFIWQVTRIQRILKKFPQPDAPQNSEEYRRWQKTYYDEAICKYFKVNVGRNILIFIGIVLGIPALIISVGFLLNYLVP